MIVRVSPVAGFQGLMRVQEALTRVPGVREAGVEAYAQGEARLRLHLNDDVEAQAVADQLARSLETAATVDAMSEAERTLRIALG